MCGAVIKATRTRKEYKTIYSNCCDRAKSHRPCLSDRRISKRLVQCLSLQPAIDWTLLFCAKKAFCSDASFFGSSITHTVIFFSAELTWIPLSLNEIKNNVIPQHSFEQFERFAFVNSVAYVSLNTSRLRYESGVFNLFSSLWSVTGLLGIIPAVMIHQFKTKRILTKRAIDARVCKQKGPSCKYVLTDPSISAYY